MTPIRGAVDPLALLEPELRTVATTMRAALPVVTGVHHGFDMLAEDAGIARRFTAVKLGALRRGLGLTD